jgi:hypothetical protein
MSHPSPSDLAQTIAQILEDAAFIFVEPTDMVAPDEAPLVVARVEVFGMAPASLVLAVPPSMGVEIAANLLGAEPDDPDAGARAADAVGEILNMMSGALSARCSTDGKPWTFGTPVTTTAAGSSLNDLDFASCGAVLITDEGDKLWTAMIAHSTSGTSELVQ